jgi:hypothetical protein
VYHFVYHAAFDIPGKSLKRFGVPGGIRTRVIAVKDQPYVYFQQLAEHGWQLRTAHERHGIRIVVRVLYEATRAYQPMFDLQKKR